MLRIFVVCMLVSSRNDARVQPPLWSLFILPCYALLWTKVRYFITNELTNLKYRITDAKLFLSYRNYYFCSISSLQFASLDSYCIPLSAALGSIVSFEWHHLVWADTKGSRCWRSTTSDAKPIRGRTLTRSVTRGLSLYSTVNLHT